MKQTDPYTILGISHEASLVEITESYRLLTLAWHPDRFPEGGMRENAATRMTEINAAYDTLRKSLRQNAPTQTKSAEPQPKPTAQRSISEEEAYYREAVRSQPSNVEVLSRLSCLLYKQNKCSEAEPFCREAVRLEPGNGLLKNDLGLVLGALGKIPEAEHWLREAVRLEPGNGSLKNNLGLALAILGKISEAEHWFREAVCLEPNNTNFKANLEGAVAEQAQRHKPAEATPRTKPTQAQQPKEHSVPKQAQQPKPAGATPQTKPTQAQPSKGSPWPFFWMIVSVGVLTQIIRSCAGH